MSNDNEGQAPVVFCDRLGALGLHDNVVRLSLEQISAGNDVTTALELLMPEKTLVELIEILTRIDEQNVEFEQAVG